MAITSLFNKSILQTTQVTNDALPFDVILSDTAIEELHLVHQPTTVDRDTYEKLYGRPCFHAKTLAAEPLSNFLDQCVLRISYSVHDPPHFHEVYWLDGDTYFREELQNVKITASLRTPWSSVCTVSLYTDVDEMFYSKDRYSVNGEVLIYCSDNFSVSPLLLGDRSFAIDDVLIYWDTVGWMSINQLTSLNALHVAPTSLLSF